MASIYNGFSFRYTYKDNVAIRVKEYYTRTESGKSWCSKPYKTETESISGQFYENYIRSIPWFNTRTFYGDRSSCRAEWNYTWAGYIPTRVTTVSPSGNEKFIDRFIFNYDN